MRTCERGAKIESEYFLNFENFEKKREILDDINF